MNAGSIPQHIHWAMNEGVVSPSTARLLLGLPPLPRGSKMHAEIDWHRFRVGTVVGSRVVGKIYQITGFEFSEQADIGQQQNIRQNIELELEEEPTHRAAPDWWIPTGTGSATAYLKFDGHAYMVMAYGYDFQTMVLKVELTRARWADQEDLTPFQREIQAFRQSLTSSQ